MRSSGVLKFSRALLLGCVNNKVSELMSIFLGHFTLSAKFFSIIATDSLLYIAHRGSGRSLYSLLYATKGEDEGKFFIRQERVSLSQFNKSHATTIQLTLGYFFIAERIPANGPKFS